MRSALGFVLSVLVFVVVFASACSDLGEFASEPTEVYRGSVIGTDDPDCAPGEVCSFIRRGFPSDTVLEMDFDPEQAWSAPGTLTTVGEACGPTFDGEPLLPIPTLAHDQLSLFEFPGDARLQNYMFVVRPTSGPLANRDAMAFVSLIRGGDIEVRIIAGAGVTDCDPSDCAAFMRGECDFFGVFRTKLRDR